MRLALVCSIALILLAGAAFGLEVYYPNPSLTPGVVNVTITQDNIKDTICRPGYTATARLNQTEKFKKRVFSRYNISWDRHSDYEDDHLISLGLGGMDGALGNRWPQLYCPKKTSGKTCFGSREKDVVESALHRRICSGEITLKEAQDIIVKDWYAEYRRIKHQP